MPPPTTTMFFEESLSLLDFALIIVRERRAVDGEENAKVRGGTTNANRPHRISLMLGSFVSESTQRNQEGRVCPNFGYYLNLFSQILTRGVLEVECLLLLAKTKEIQTSILMFRL